MKINEAKTLETIKRLNPSPKEAIGMILSSCADWATENGAMISVKRFDMFSDVLIEYFDLNNS